MCIAYDKCVNKEQHNSGVFSRVTLCRRKVIEM